MKGNMGEHDIIKTWGKPNSFFIIHCFIKLNSPKTVIRVKFVTNSKSDFALHTSTKFVQFPLTNWKLQSVTVPRP